MACTSEPVIFSQEYDSSINQDFLELENLVLNLVLELFFSKLFFSKLLYACMTAGAAHRIMLCYYLLSEKILNVEF